jgi:ribosomal protein S18 acetylase RimI-like enzyme
VLAFYQRLGYVEVERLTGYYRGREDAVLLAKALRPALSVAHEEQELRFFGPDAAHLRDGDVPPTADRFRRP